MRTLHVITSLAVGGAERMLCKLLGADLELRSGAVVVCLGGDGPLGEDLRVLGVPVHCLELSPVWPKVRPWQELRRLRRHCEPDLIQGWMYHGNVGAWVAGRGGPGPIPVIFNVRQTVQPRQERLTTLAWILLQGLMSRQCAAVIYNSAAAVTQHERLGFRGAQSLVIPNGFDLDTYRPEPEARPRLRARLGIPSTAPLIGMAARYDPMKGHEQFVQAAALLHRQRPEVHFVLAGPGVDGANWRLRQTIAKAGVQGVVHCMGTQREMAPWFAGLDVAASCSTMKEGFSNAIGEAMACGIPCVVTDVGASAAIVGETGAVVPARNADAVATAWEWLLAMGTSERQSRGERARMRIQEKFGLPAVASQYRELYKAIAAGSPPAAAATDAGAA